MFFGNKKDIIDMDSDELKRQLKKQFRSFLIIVLLVIAGFAISQCWYTVTEQENAVVTTAGKHTSTREAGLHFKIPILQNVTKVNMTTRGMTLGYSEPGMGEVYSYNNAMMGMGERYDVGDNLMISNDFNIVSIDFYAEWRVRDPVKVLFAVEDPVQLLSNIIQSSARDIVSAYVIDRVLTDGKDEIQTEILDLVKRVLNTYDIGITMEKIRIQDAEPPTAEVVAAFKAVENARQSADRMLNEANKYRNENIPEARAEAYRITERAEAIKEARINEAKGQASRFNEMFTQYQNNREITRTRMYLETMENVMPGLKVFIDGTGGGNPVDGGSGVLKILDIGQEVE